MRNLITTESTPAAEMKSAPDRPARVQARTDQLQPLAGYPPGRKIHVGPNTRGQLSPAETGRLVEITLNYFPNEEETGNLVRQHIRNADSLRLARDADGWIAGFSIASVSRRITPFYPRPIPLVYQRMLYLDPDIMQRGLGKRLLIATFRDLLGQLWALRRFALVCRTLNPVVARMMDMHSVSYPHHGEAVPDRIREFGESLLPMLGATRLDEQFRLIGSLEEFRGTDFTDIWNRHLHRRHDSYEDFMLERAFTQDNGRIINNGALIMILAYSKPLQFLRYLFHR